MREDAAVDDGPYGEVTACPERLGLFGGTFDPPHAGHIAAALACRRALELDRVLLVVANDPWQKVPQREVTPAKDRWAMVVAATKGLEGVEASRIEIERGGPSYTVDTVEELRNEARRSLRPFPEIFLVVGVDLVPTLETWERADELRRLVTLVAVSRPGAPEPRVPQGWKILRVDGDGVDVSSSEVRTMLTEGRSVNGLLPEPVMRCIRQRNLYAVER